MPESVDEKYTLAWTEFQSTFSNSLDQLRRENAFHDLTLVSDDEVHMNAHKVVLSAASSFFKRLLKRHPHQSPLLYLSGVQACDLKFILDYVYQGQVHLLQNQVNSFLVAAAKLKIAGLTNLATQQVGHQEESSIDIGQKSSEFEEDTSKEGTIRIIEEEISMPSEKSMLTRRKRGRPRKDTTIQPVYSAKSEIVIGHQDYTLEENPDKAETMRLIEEEVIKSRTVEGPMFMKRKEGRPVIKSKVPVMSGPGQRVMYYKEYENSEQLEAKEYVHQDLPQSLIDINEQKTSDPLLHEFN